MKLLVLLSRVPYPLEKGDKLRAFHHIKHLSQSHEIHLCCINDSELHPDAEKILLGFCNTVTIFHINKINIYLGLLRALFNGLPFQIGYFYHPFIQKKINHIIDKIKPDHIFCQLIRVTEYVKKSAIPKTLDYQDVFSKGAERMASKASVFMRPILTMESKRVKKYEREIFSYFDNKLIISEQDRDAIHHHDKLQIQVVPNGVDTKTFSPIAKEKKYDILFSGNMAYPPNIDSACYLVNQILPILHKKLPHVKVLIAGVSPDSRVKSLASTQVYVSGWVENIRDCYAESRIFVAPMQIGTGLQNKLLEAMAMKLPCVSSGLANNALHARENTEILIGYSPEDYAEKIHLLLTDSTVYQTISEAGFALVHKNFGWEQKTEIINRLIINSLK